MKKFIGIITGIISIGILGFSIAILDVGSVGGVKTDIDIDEAVAELERNENEKKEQEMKNEIENKKENEEYNIEKTEINNNLNEESKDAILNYNSRIENIIREEIKNYDFDISVSFRDLKTNEPVYINNRKTRAACMIKVFIMVEVYNQISYGQIKIFDKLVLEEGDKVEGNGILKTMENGTSYSIKELVELMISKSDNTATNMLIKLLGMDNINRTIESLGFKRTVLKRFMMDEDAKDSGLDNYTSVKDLDLLFSMLYNGECLGNEYDKIMIEMLEKCEDDKKISNKLPNDIIIAHKTGELRGVENDGGIIFTKKGDYILNVLIERANKKEAEEAISNISEKIYFEVINHYK